MATVSLNPPASSSAPPEEAAPAGLPEGIPYRLTADDYFRMVEADIIPPDRRVGLWRGRLYEKMAKKIPHSTGYNLLIEAMRRPVPEGWCTWSKSPILVDDFSAPLPDFTIVRGTPNSYYQRGTVPRPEDIGLVVEVAESSLRKNLTETLQTYARAGLPCYWVVNLVARRVEVYSEPVVEGETARYAVSELIEVGKDVPLVLDGREVARIPARDLLPKEAS
jgi:Uma2 family endonuclease